MTTIEIRTLPLANLKPAPYNPRRMLAPGSPAYRKLKASLTEFGLVEPLVWNELTGHVVGGHARLRVLTDLGASAVPVAVVHLTAARERALNVVLNNAEAQGRFDPAMLADVLADLDGTAEFALTGFDPETLDSLRFRPTEAPAREIADTDRVEVTLATDAATYDRLAPELDSLVAEYDLVAHVRRGG